MKTNKEIIPELDFSEFHPLDHGIWQPVCWGWYGGIPQHIRLWWDYQMEDRIYAATLCKLGRHHRTGVWHGWRPLDREPDNEPDKYMCAHCWEPMERG